LSRVASKPASLIDAEAAKGWSLKRIFWNSTLASPDLSRTDASAGARRVSVEKPEASASRLCRDQSAVGVTA
jgi:hypothetical protein